MTDNDFAALNVAATALLEEAQVDVFAPRIAAPDLASLSQYIEDEERLAAASKGIAAQVPQRKVLYLDENASVCVLLKCILSDETHIKYFLERLEITLEAYAVGTQRPGNERQEDPQVSVKDVIDTKVITDSDPEVAISNSTDAGTDPSRPYVHALWKTDVHISRSRIRSYGPSAYFSVALRLRKLDADGHQSMAEDFMESGVPASLNLLDAFKNDPVFHGKAPVLTLARLSKMTPSSGLGIESGRPLRNPQRRMIRLVPAINTRIQFSRIGISPTQTKVLALLDVEASSFTNGEVSLTQLSLLLSDGRAEAYGSPETLAFPRICHPSDVLSYVYDLHPQTSSTEALSATREGKPAHSISLRLLATLNLPDTSSPQEAPLEIPIRVQWRHSVDLSPVLSSSRSQLLAQPSSPAFSNHLLTLTVSGPSQVTCHSLLHWTLLIANRSPTRTLRLALIPLTSGSANIAQASAPNATSAEAKLRESDGAVTPRRPHRPTLKSSFFSASHISAAAAAVAMAQKNAAAEAAGLVPTTPDVRVGPLLPGASAEAQIQFLVLKEGVLRIEGIRVVDLDVEANNAFEGENRQARSWVDVGAQYLPDIIATQ